MLIGHLFIANVHITLRNALFDIINSFPPSHLRVSSSSKGLEMSVRQPQSWGGAPHISRVILLKAQADRFQWKLFLLNSTALVRQQEMPTF